jgi:hypothetical protein
MVRIPGDVISTSAPPGANENSSRPFARFAAKAHAPYDHQQPCVEAGTAPDYDELYAEYWASFPPLGCPGHL